MPRKKVTIIGAGATGGAMAQRLIERDICDVVLQDDPQFAGTMHFGKALDEAEAAAWTGFSHRISATDGWAETRDSDVVICTAGAPRKPGMSREELLNGNAEIVAAKIREASKYSPGFVSMRCGQYASHESSPLRKSVNSSVPESMQNGNAGGLS